MAIIATLRGKSRTSDEATAPRPADDAPPAAEASRPTLRSVFGMASPDIADIPIPRLGDDPTYRDLAARIEPLERDLRELQLEKECITISHSLSTIEPGHRAYAGMRANLDRAQAQLAELKRSKAPDAAQGSRVSPPGVVAMQSEAAAIAVRNGIAPHGPLDHAARVEELDRKIRIVGRAVAELSTHLGERVEQLRYDFSKRIKPSIDQLNRFTFRHAQEIAAATAAFLAFRAAARAGGLPLRDDIAKIEGVPVILGLGSESETHSQISAWRRALEDGGVI